MPHIRVCDQVFEEIERRAIQPLQIVEEQRQRVLLTREHAEESPEYHPKPVLVVWRRQVWNRRLFSNDELELWNEVHHELTIRAERFPEGIPPSAEFHLPLTQKRSY